MAQPDSTNRLKELRNAKGLTARDLAEHLGVQQLTIYRYESGKLKLTVDAAQKIATLLGCTLDELFPAPTEQTA